MMKVVIAIDSFKGSLSSLQAGTAAATGIYRVDPKVETVVRPLADGGEGTVQALTEGLGGRLVSVSVTGPAGKQVCRGTQGVAHLLHRGQTRPCDG